MPKYVVQVEGRNFLVERDGKTERHGFFTVQFIEAADVEAAKNAAVEAIRNTESLRDVVRNASDDPPVLDVTRALETESFGEVECRDPGFAWYKEHPKRWWQFWRL